MGFFRRRQQEPAGHALPRNIVPLMERFGRSVIDRQESAEDASDIWQQTQSPLLPFLHEAPTEFMAALAEAVLPVGGWAVYGAERTILDLISPPPDQNASYNAIMNASLEFLRTIGVTEGYLTGYEWQHWVANGGTHESWLGTVRRPTPSQDEAPITNLGPGETRRVAQLASRPDANLIVVRQMDDGRYCALTDARQSDENPTRSQWEWKSAESLHELYIEIGLSLQVPAYWYDPELEPYFPLPRPKI